MQACPWALVDAFVGEGARGNPAAVLLLPGPAPEAYLQQVAAELAQAETAFLWPEGEGWSLRWFTPLVEVSLCGHATLAATAFLLGRGMLQVGQVARFSTLSGPLSAQAVSGPEGASALAPLGQAWAIELDFPAEAPEAVAQAPEGLEAALGLEGPAPWVGRNRLAWVVALPDEGALRDLRPDLAALARLGEDVLVCAPGQAHDVASRYFAPAQGILEDHATGSAHAALGPMWAKRLGRDALRCWQASPRGGLVGVRLLPEGRVGLRGWARWVGQGALLGPEAWGAGAELSLAASAAGDPKPPGR